MGIRKTIARRVLWPALSSGTAWLATQAAGRLRGGRRKKRKGKKAMARADFGARALVWSAATAAVFGVAEALASHGTEAVLRRVAGRRPARS